MVEFQKFVFAAIIVISLFFSTDTVLNEYSQGVKDNSVSNLNMSVVERAQRKSFLQTQSLMSNTVAAIAFPINIVSRVLLMYYAAILAFAVLVTLFCFVDKKQRDKAAIFKNFTDSIVLVRKFSLVRGFLNIFRRKK